MKPENPLLRLKALGQSVWLDDIRRGWFDDGTLARLIEQDGVSGVTSNPAIFQKAIGETRDYDTAIARLVKEGAGAAGLHENLVIDDMQRAAGRLHGVYEESHRRDGYVSLEVSPHLAHDTEGTFAEAMRLWTKVDRPNLMVKVPATRAGLPAIRRLVAAGVNVNVTLLFSVARYRDVAEAYIAGLEQLAANGGPIGAVASVASFFVSRIDTWVDKRLDALAPAPPLRGQAAVASARLAYQAYRQIVATSRWQALAARGAAPQRLLWGSTGTKDERYRDVKYVESLIGPDTVNTMPLKTLEAFRDHGVAAARLEDDLDGARALPARLLDLGIDLAEAGQQLEDEGVQKFIEPHDRLMAALQERIRSAEKTR